jgi:hypothetical protein
MNYQVIIYIILMLMSRYFLKVLLIEDNILYMVVSDFFKMNLYNKQWLEQTLVQWVKKKASPGSWGEVIKKYHGNNTGELQRDRRAFADTERSMHSIEKGWTISDCCLCVMT